MIGPLAQVLGRRQRHRDELARLSAAADDNLTRTLALQRGLVERRVRRTAVTWLLQRAESYRLDADHIDNAKPYTTRSDGRISPEVRRVIQHELEALADDLAKEPN